MKNKIISTILFICILSLPIMVWAEEQAEKTSGIMPDSPFYFLKIWYEKIITFISFGDARKAEYYNKLAEKRLYEAEKMAQAGKDALTKKLLEEYEKNLKLALEKLEEMKEDAQAKAKEAAKQKIKEKMDEALKVISESTIKNQEVLAKVQGIVPDSAKEAVGTVIKVTKSAYEQILDLISGIKK